LHRGKENDAGRYLLFRGDGSFGGESAVAKEKERKGYRTMGDRTPICSWMRYLARRGRPVEKKGVSIF